MNLNEITDLARQYAGAHTALAEAVSALEADVLKAKRQHLGKIKRLTAVAATRKATLHTAIETSPELFEKPRTHVVDGIKFGMAKQRGCITFADGDAVVERIKRLFPKLADSLIRRVESPDKTALNNLTADELRRLGCTLTEDDDKVVITAIGGDVEKIVSALLKDATENAIETEAA